MKNKIKAFSLVFLTSVLSISNVFAESGKTKDAVEKTIDNVVNWLTIIGGGLAVVSIVVAGLMMVWSHENEKNVSTAKDVIKWAMIGLGVILMARILTSIVSGLVVIN